MNDQPRDDEHQDDQPVEQEATAYEAAAHEPDGAAGGATPWMQGRGRWIAAGGLAVLLVTGVGAGAYAVGTAGGDAGDGTNQGDGDRDRDGGRDDDADAGDDGGDAEQELVGSELAAVTDAVRAAFGGAVVVEAETDADGVYEAHIVTRDGEEITVELDEDVEITGVEDDR